MITTHRPPGTKFSYGEHVSFDGVDGAETTGTVFNVRYHHDCVMLLVKLDEGKTEHGHSIYEEVRVLKSET